MQQDLEAMKDQEIMDRFVEDAKRIIELKDRVRELEAMNNEYREALTRISWAKANKPEDRYGDGGVLQRCVETAKKSLAKYE